MDPGFAPSSRLSAVHFLTYTGPQLCSISVKKITNPETFDSLLHPNLGGLYDPSLGPSDKFDLCGTCGLNYVHCPGHMGHIALPLPVYHPVFFMSLYQLLRASCWACHRLLAPPLRLALVRGQLELLDRGCLEEAASLEERVVADLGSERLKDADSCVQVVSAMVSQHQRTGPTARAHSKNMVETKRRMVQEFLKQCSSGTSSCPHCSAPFRPLRQDGRVRIFMKGLSNKQGAQWRAALLKERGGGGGGGGGGEEVRQTLLHSSGKQDVTEQLYVSPVEVKVHVQHMWERERQLLSALFGGATTEKGLSITDLFFLTVLPVPPSRFRPVSPSPGTHLSTR